MAEIRSAKLIPEKPGYAVSPDGVEFKVNTCTAKTFWHFGGKVPVLELLQPEKIGERYFYVPFYFLNEATGSLTFFEKSLAQVAHLIVKEWVRTRDWAKVIDYEDV